jgi:ATP-binding cassette subfamily F protein uup
VENFPGNYSDRAYEDSADVSKRGKQSREERLFKITNWNLTFNEQKNFKKLEREIKDLEEQN